MRWITLADYLLLPVYLVVIYVLAFRFRNRHYPPGHAWRPYFLPGLTVKIVGALLIGLIYQYYYGGGDTANYFNQAKAVNSALADSPSKWLNLVFHIPQWYEGAYIKYISQIPWYEALNNYLVADIAAVLGLLTFTTFLPTSVLFAVLSFTGIWAMFRAFASQYPTLIKPIAMVVLFIPSVALWGSGIFKDTLCMFSLGWLFYVTYQLLLRGRIPRWNLVLAVAGFLLLFLIKIYILAAFIPPLLLWVSSSYLRRIRQPLIRIGGIVALVGISGIGFYAASGWINAQLGGYSLENVVNTSSITREYISRISGSEGSAYDLGTIDPTFTGMLAKFPQAVNVTLFRPYPWESRKPIVLFNALEAFLFLFVTLKILFGIGLSKAFRAIRQDPTIQFCLIFTLIFAFSVGISSGNFGALSRYRIPCLPLYGTALVLIYHRYRPTTSSILSLWN